MIFTIPSRQFSFVFNRIIAKTPSSRGPFRQYWDHSKFRIPITLTGRTFEVLFKLIGPKELAEEKMSKISDHHYSIRDLSEVLKTIEMKIMIEMFPEFKQITEFDGEWFINNLGYNLMTMFQELSKQNPEKYKTVAENNEKYTEFKNLFQSCEPSEKLTERFMPKYKIEKEMAKAYLSQLTMFSKKYAMKELEDCINEAFDDKFWESVAEIDKNYPEFAKYNKEHCDI